MKARRPVSFVLDFNTQTERDRLTTDKSPSIPHARQYLKDAYLKIKDLLQNYLEEL